MFKTTVIFVMITFFLFGCSDQVVEEKVYSNVARVFWHEGNRYSVFIELEEGVYDRVSFSGRLCSKTRGVVEGVTIVSDVPPGELMWVREKTLDDSRNRGVCLIGLEIHLHDIQDLEGGSWDHGKFGRGSTVSLN